MSAVLGIDVGTVRVGVAVGDPTGVIASPVESLPRRDAPALWERLRRIVAEHECERAVVGLPRMMDGSEGSAAAAARAFAAELHAALGIPVEMWDERLTTVQAERSMIAAGTRRRQRRERIDAVAAGIMLQAWLDSQRRRT